MPPKIEIPSLDFCELAGLQRSINISHGLNELRTFIDIKPFLPKPTTLRNHGADSFIAGAGFEHDGEEKTFSYAYLSGSNLLQTLAMPNGVTLMQTYEAQRDLLTGMTYATATETLAQRSYAYSLSRLTSLCH